MTALSCLKTIDLNGVTLVTVAQDLNNEYLDNSYYNSNDVNKIQSVIN